MEEIWDMVPGKCPELIVQSIADAKKSHPPMDSHISFFQSILQYLFPTNEEHPLPNQLSYPKKNIY
jgi:hypothetical protein